MPSHKTQYSGWKGTGKSYEVEEAKSIHWAK